MRGSEHYREAETFLRHANEARGDGDYESVAHFLHWAQVHATLAGVAVAVVNGLPVSKAWADAFVGNEPDDH